MVEGSLGAKGARRGKGKRFLLDKGEPVIYLISSNLKSGKFVREFEAKG
jgi:hypothetical protein